MLGALQRFCTGTIVSRLGWLIVAGSIGMPALAVAPPAVRLFIYIPCVGTCPGQVQIIRVTAGEVFPIFVAAEDAPGFPDPGYTGTVTFSSTDPLATLPGPYTFTPADQGYHLFLKAGILKTVGSQTISVTDSSGVLPTGSWNVTVDAPAGVIPTTTATGAAIFAVLLLTSGVWLLHSRT
jgi:hypothetical protein